MRGTGTEIIRFNQVDMEFTKAFFFRYTVYAKKSISKQKSLSRIQNKLFKMTSAIILQRCALSKHRSMTF